MRLKSLLIMCLGMVCSAVPLQAQQNLFAPYLLVNDQAI